MTATQQRRARKPAAKPASKPRSKPAAPPAPEPKDGQLFATPKPELTLLHTVADNFDPEDLTVTFGGALKYTAHAERPVAFINGCRPGRRQRITIDTVVSKGGTPTAKENNDGEIVHALGVSLKVTAIDFDDDPWTPVKLDELRRQATQLVLAHARGDETAVSMRAGNLELLLGVDVADQEQDDAT